MVLVFYWLCRIAFVVMYPEMFAKLTIGDWFSFVILSLRFDASTIASIDLVFWVILLLPFHFHRNVYGILKWTFVVANSLFLLLNAIDVPFFAFNNRRTSYTTLEFLLADSLRQLPQLMVHYWPMIPVFGLMIFGLYRSFPARPSGEHSKPLTAFFQVLVCVGLGVMMIRNSFQLKPMLPGEAFTLPQSEAGHAVLTTPFLLFKSTGFKPLPDQKWLSESESTSLFPQNQSGPAPLKGHNVVLIILESFATEYTGLEGNATSYTPFLDSLAGAGIYFPHHFANGRTSRDALPSILASVPAWMDEAFANSPYLSIRMEGLGTRLKKDGYQTAFFHGGKNGTMAFDLFSKVAGFDAYYGMNEYPDHKDFDGNWGIFDEPFLQYVSNRLDGFKQPFAAGIFTLSSHQPYTIPDRYKGRFKKGPLPVHEAVSYSDFALRRFFENARTKPWFANTLFVLTADHTQASIDPNYAGLVGSYDVPLVLFSPSVQLNADTNRWVQHLDLAPGISDLVGSKSSYENKLGNSLRATHQGYPIVFQDQKYHLFHPDGNLSWTAINPEEGWLWQAVSNRPEPTGLRTILISRVQYYRQGLIHNQLFQKTGDSK